MYIGYISNFVTQNFYVILTGEIYPFPCGISYPFFVFDIFATYFGCFLCFYIEKCVFCEINILMIR